MGGWNWFQKNFYRAHQEPSNDIKFKEIRPLFRPQIGQNLKQKLFYGRFRPELTFLLVSRCKEAFDLLISHQKMAEELKCRKLFSRKVEPERIRRLQVDKPVDTSPPEVIMPESPLKPSVQPAEPNAVRIYVPFSDSRKSGADELDSSSNSAQFRNTSTDVTTRLIQVDNESPVPELVRPGTSSGPSSPAAVSRTSRDSVCGAPSGPSSPRKSTLVRMGTKISTDALIREKYRLFNDPVIGSGAYVVGKNNFPPSAPLVRMLTNNSAFFPT